MYLEGRIRPESRETYLARYLARWVEDLGVREMLREMLLEETEKRRDEE